MNIDYFLGIMFYVSAKCKPLLDWESLMQIIAIISNRLHNHHTSQMKTCRKIEF